MVFLRSLSVSEPVKRLLQSRGFKGLHQSFQQGQSNRRCDLRALRIGGNSFTLGPSGVFYGELKREVYWDPLRQDPRFEKLLAELAPRD
jgi:hypothetical protein